MSPSHLYKYPEINDWGNINILHHPISSLASFFFADVLCMFSTPAAAVVAGWFLQCAFLWSDWSAPPLSAELTDETEHPSVFPPTGTSYHSSEWKRELCLCWCKVQASGQTTKACADSWSIQQILPLCFHSNQLACIMTSCQIPTLCTLFFCVLACKIKMRGGVGACVWLPEPLVQTPESSSWPWAELYSLALGSFESEAPAGVGAPTPTDAVALIHV